jgi:hypothetical protein
MFNIIIKIRKYQYLRIEAPKDIYQQYYIVELFDLSICF